jgi:hypothetical protein
MPVKSVISAISATHADTIENKWGKFARGESRGEFVTIVTVGVRYVYNRLTLENGRMVEPAVKRQAACFQ